MRNYGKTSSYWGYHRCPKTTQERRMNGCRSDRHEESHYKYVRGKRRGKNIPHSWDDLAVSAWDERRCWKANRKTQYRVGGRGTRHELLVPKDRDRFRYWWNAEYRLEDYFKDHDIPYNKERLYETYTREHIDYTYRICVGREPVFNYIKDETGTYRIDKTKVLWYKHIWEDVPYDKPRVKVVTYSTHIGCRFTYWTDKRLNLDFAFAGP